LQSDAQLQPVWTALNPDPSSPGLHHTPPDSGERQCKPWICKWRFDPRSVLKPPHLLQSDAQLQPVWAALNADPSSPKKLLVFGLGMDSNYFANIANRGGKVSCPSCTSMLRDIIFVY
jgi:hypothetical protein